jgi:glycerophosphoryl diester phosphodiesterase
MGVTRRQAALLTTAWAFAPAAARAAPTAGLILFDGPPARAAWDRAIDQGADFLVAPVAACQDGTLVVAPDIELSAFTDVAQRPEFAARRKDKTLDGAPLGGWFCDDFTLAELKTLATGPAPPRRGGGPPPASPGVLSLQDVIDIARAGCVRQARVVGVSPRLVRPAYFESGDLALEPKLADAIRVAGYDSPAAAMLVQAFEPGALKTFEGLSRARRMQLADLSGGPADPSAMRFEAMLSPDGLAAVRGWADAIAAPEAALIQAAPKGPPQPTGLVDAARAAHLGVYARVPPPQPHEPYGGPRARLAALFAAGVDGVICADPGLAAKARGDALHRA